MSCFGSFKKPVLCVISSKYLTYFYSEEHLGRGMHNKLNQQNEIELLCYCGMARWL